MPANDPVAASTPIRLDAVCETLPPPMPFAPGIRRAPRRDLRLSAADTERALTNALRYVPPRWHDILAAEFLDELRTMGRIYAYRFRPEGRLWGRPVDDYPARCSSPRAWAA